MKKNISLRLGELFCGPGGIGCGAKMSAITVKGRSFGFKHTWATDNHKDSCDTYRNNLDVKQIIHLPIEKLFLNKNKLRNMGKVDCLTFGFPCNDFSNVGEKKGFKQSIFRNESFLDKKCRRREKGEEAFLLGRKKIERF